MFLISNLLFVTLVPAIFTDAYVTVPYNNGVTPNMFPPQITRTMPGYAIYPRITSQPIVHSHQPVPQFMSDPSKINGVNPHVFAQQPPPMIQGTAFNPYMTIQPEVQRSPFVPPFMSDPIMQGYQHPNQMMMPMPTATDQFRQQIAFLIQSAALRLRTLLAFAERFVPPTPYNEPFSNNMGQSGLYPMPYAQQFQPKTESQEDFREEILEQQQQNANEQQRAINNDHRAQVEFEAELENKRLLEFEKQEIERERKEAEEKIKQEEEEEKQMQERERKLREEQEFRLKQIEEASRNKKKPSEETQKINTNSKQPQQKVSKITAKQRITKLQPVKVKETNASDFNNIEDRIKTISEIKNQQLSKTGNSQKNN